MNVERRVIVEIVKSLFGHHPIARGNALVARQYDTKTLNRAFGVPIYVNYDCQNLTLSLILLDVEAKWGSFVKK